VEYYERGEETLDSINVGNINWATAHAAAQLVEALRYKPDGAGFDS